MRVSIAQKIEKEGSLGDTTLSKEGVVPPRKRPYSHDMGVLAHCTVCTANHETFASVAQGGPETHHKELERGWVGIMKIA